MRQAARKDENQDRLIEVMRMNGVSSANIRQPVDLVVAADLTMLTCMVEVKNPEKKRRDRRLKPAQMKFFNMWPGSFMVMETEEQARDLSHQLNHPDITYVGGEQAFDLKGVAEYCTDQMIAYFQEVYGGIPMDEFTDWRWHQYNGFCRSGRTWGLSDKRT